MDKYHQDKLSNLSIKDRLEKLETKLIISYSSSITDKETNCEFNRYSLEFLISLFNEETYKLKSYIFDEKDFFEKNLFKKTERYIYFFLHKEYYNKVVNHIHLFVEKLKEVIEIYQEQIDRFRPDFIIQSKSLALAQQNVTYLNVYLNFLKQQKQMLCQ